MLRIAHITDTHICEEGKDCHGMDTRGKFLRVLEDIKNQDVDLLIHTGDLYYPDEAGSLLPWIKEQLDALEIPYLLTAGNHDDVMSLQEIFNEKDCPPKLISTGAVAMKGESLMFLDSSAGRMSVKQSLWFKREMDAQPRDMILFQHHPPCPCEVRVMDEKYPYQTSALFLKCLPDDKSRSMTVFSGHYHFEKEVHLESKQLHIYLSPATLGSIDPESQDYIIVDDRPGWREIEIEEQKIINTTSHYLDFFSKSS